MLKGESSMFLTKGFDLANLRHSIEIHSVFDVNGTLTILLETSA